jgi:uncharacterized OB-fold protein
MTQTVQMSDSAPLWSGFEEGEVRLPYCMQCGEPHLPAGPVCPYCFSGKLEWRPASGDAHLSSWVVERKKVFMVFDPPYIVGEVQLAEGPRMPVQVDLSELSKLKAEMPGHIEFSVAPNGLTLPKFVPTR